MLETFARGEGALNKLANSLISPLAAARRFVLRHPAQTICCCILFLMGANLLSAAARKTVTNDEIVHIPAGYYYLVSGNFRLNPEHPPLVKMWACLPVLFLRPEVRALTEPAGQDFAQFTVTSAIDFWHVNRPRFRAISFWSRLPMVLLTLTFGALIFVYGRQLFGARAALLSVALFSLEPTMLAHGRIVHTDIAAALGYLLFFFALQTYCRAPTFSRAAWFGMATGFALLTKFSMVVLIPIFVAGLVYGVWTAPRCKTSHWRIALQFCAAALIVIVLLNAAYYFQHPALAQPETNWIAATMPLASARIMLAIRVLSRVLPTYYLFGLYTLVVHNHFGHPASLLGEYSAFGWWYYFPIAFALKTTIPFLLVSICALGWALWGGILGHEKKLLALLIPIALYMTMSMMSNINIGIRHIAPVFPFLFLLGGGGLDRLLKSNVRGRAAAVLTVVLLGWMLVDAVRAYPDYMSFMSPLTLGKPGWQLLSDSNVEWGDDVGALARYLHDHGETKVRAGLSGGWATLEMYDIQLVDFAPPDVQRPGTRYIAIGAGLLNGSTVPAGLRDANGAVLSEEQTHNFFASYRAASPEAVFGRSIYLYRAKD